MKTYLLNPGPVTLSAGVRAAMDGPDLCHREPEFSALQTGLKQKLLDVYQLDRGRWTAVLLTGSGTAAVEAMLVSCIPAEGRLLTVENGVYGERMSKIAHAYGIECSALSAPWQAPIDEAALNQTLADGNFTHVAVVHHETTTGRLNDLDSLLAICHEHGAKVLLDGVSSFGAENIDFTHPAMAACAATANKCLHGVPGTAFVVAERAELETPQDPRCVYLDLRSYHAQQESGGTPFTQSIQTFYALDTALDEFFVAGGQSARRALFRERMSRVRGHLGTLGIQPLLGDNEVSCVLNAFELPQTLGYDELHDGLKDDGFVIYAGQGRFAKSLFRISTMGEISPAAVEQLCESLTRVLRPG